MKITKYVFPIKQKIAILADIHNKMFDLSLLKREKVDFIVIPGDICSTHLSQKASQIDDHSREWSEPKNAIKLLQELPKIAPTFLSKGNHESIWNTIDHEFVKGTGTVLLDNDMVMIDGTIIGGISSPSRNSVGKEEMSNVSDNLIKKMEEEKGTRILLLHEPHLYFNLGIDKRDVDLVVSGHAHGGQWRFFNQGILAPGQGLFPKYTKGIYDGKLLVSAGMSNTASPIPRLFNPKELVIIEPL